jgi:hypothetical protein
MMAPREDLPGPTPADGELVVDVDRPSMAKFSISVA